MVDRERSRLATLEAQTNRQDSADPSFESGLQLHPQIPRAHQRCHHLHRQAPARSPRHAHQIQLSKHLAFVQHPQKHHSITINSVPPTSRLPHSHQHLPLHPHPHSPLNHYRKSTNIHHQG